MKPSWSRPHPSAPAAWVRASCWPKVDRGLGGRLRALLDPRQDHAVARRGQHLGERDAALDLGRASAARPPRPRRTPRARAAASSSARSGRWRGAAGSPWRCRRRRRARSRRPTMPRSSSARRATSGWRAIRRGPRPASERAGKGGHDRVARALDHRQHLLEAVGPTVVRVRHLATRIDRIEVAEQPHPLASARRRRRGWPRPSRAPGRTPRARSRRTAGRGAGSGRSPRR